MNVLEEHPECLKWARKGSETVAQRCEAYMARPDASESLLCPGGGCGTCMEGTEWQRYLGRPSGQRSVEMRLIGRDWLSQQLVTAIAVILLREAMNYPVKVIDALNEDWRSPVSCCGRRVTNMEGWDQLDEGPYTSQERDVRLLGYEGIEELFVPEAVALRDQRAQAFSTYTGGEVPAGLELPRARDIDCRTLLRPNASECRPGNYMCDNNDWNDTKCVDGTYVPPLCQPATADCWEVLMPNTPRFSGDWYEAVVRNLRLSFVLAYYPLDVFKERVQSRVDLGLNTIFYWFYPSPWLEKLKGVKPLLLPRATMKCTNRWQQDPSRSGVNCSRRLLALKKVSSLAVATDGDLHNFTSRIALTETDVQGMLRQHVESGGSEASPWRIACAWILANNATWSKWISNTPYPEDPNHVGDLLRVTVPIFAVALIVGIAGAVYLVRRAHVHKRVWSVKEETILYAQGVGEVTMHALDIVTDGLSLWQQAKEGSPLWLSFGIVFAVSTAASVLAVGLSLRKLQDVANVQYRAVDIARRAMQASQAAMAVALLEDLPLLVLSMISIVHYDVDNTFVLISVVFNAAGLGWKAYVSLEFMERRQRYRVLQSIEEEDLAARDKAGETGGAKGQSALPSFRADVEPMPMAGKPKLRVGGAASAVIGAFADAPFHTGLDSDQMRTLELRRRSDAFSERMHSGASGPPRVRSGAPGAAVADLDQPLLTAPTAAAAADSGEATDRPPLGGHGLDPAEVERPDRRTTHSPHDSAQTNLRVLPLALGRGAPRPTAAVPSAACDSAAPCLQSPAPPRGRGAGVPGLPPASCRRPGAGSLGCSVSAAGSM
eukprot:TRINITY_DN21089_c0_g1_i5.p1 TRINITY_DN21089_c0_g1~~TRINITY_DN21089_c0_g1_i5.p1  ORF type:complete len:856 (+),score=84.26 TRINITY_DN21089_c0_g1_i5:78-2570(+)